MTEDYDLLDAFQKTADVLEMITTDPVGAAVELEAIAVRLWDLAQLLRDQGAPRSEGGVSDRIMVRVLGPDGKTRQYVDTAHS